MAKTKNLVSTINLRLITKNIHNTGTAGEEQIVCELLNIKLELKS